MTRQQILTAVSEAYGKPTKQSASSYIAFVPYDKLDGPITEIRADSYYSIVRKLKLRKTVHALELMGHNTSDVDYLVNCEHQFSLVSWRLMVRAIDRYLSCCN